MRLLDLISKQNKNINSLETIYKYVKNDPLETLFIYETDKNKKSIKALLSASDGVNFNFNKNVHVLGKIDAKGLVNASIDGLKWFPVGVVKEKIQTGCIVLILFTKPDIDHLYGANKAIGHNLYAKIFKQ